MNRKFFALALVFSLISILPLTAQVQEDTKGEPGQLQVVEEYDWGTVTPAKLQANIEIKNVGEGDLHIDRVKPSCGCTLLDPLEKNVLAPGESTTVHLSLDASRRTGSLRKSLLIYSDDPNFPTKTVSLVANVQNDVSLNSDTEK